MTRSMTWIFYAKCDDDELTSTYVAWYKISVQLAIIVIMEILTPTIVTMMAAFESVGRFRESRKI